MANYSKYQNNFTAESGATSAAPMFSYANFNISATNSTAVNAVLFFIVRLLVRLFSALRISIVVHVGCLISLLNKATFANGLAI